MDNGRRCFMFQVDRKQLPRLKKVLEYAKMNNKWRKPFNNRVVLVELVPNWRKGEPKTLTLRRLLYQKMICDHNCNNSSTSYMPFPAMYNCTTVYTLKRFKADGTPKKNYMLDHSMTSWRHSSGKGIRYLAWWRI